MPRRHHLCSQLINVDVECSQRRLLSHPGRLHHRQQPGVGDQQPRPNLTDESGELAHEPLDIHAYTFLTPNNDRYYGPLSAITLIKLADI